MFVFETMAFDTGPSADLALFIFSLHKRRSVFAQCVDDFMLTV